GYLDCGSCAAGQSCTAHKCAANCTPKTCAQLGAQCGSASDGCGGTLACGSCPSGESCGAGGVTNKCFVQSQGGATRWQVFAAGDVLGLARSDSGGFYVLSAGARLTLEKFSASGAQLWIRVIVNNI